MNSKAQLKTAHTPLKQTIMMPLELGQAKDIVELDTEKNHICITLQSCLDAGAGPDLLHQIIAMFRRFWMHKPLVLAFIDDMEVRYITSLEGESNC
ncbi:MAG: hypothetical protein K6T94_21855 [Paenibacillus sp.]|nr:hypothetical protein [Paenibacillus sp.]